MFHVSQLSLYVKYNSLSDEKLWNVEISYKIQKFLPNFCIWQPAVVGCPSTAVVADVKSSCDFVCAHMQIMFN